MLPWAIGLFLIVITAAVYSPVRHHEFINFDDGGYVYENEHVQKGLTPDSIKWAFTLVKSDEKSYWHPVTWLSHMLDCQLFGLNAGYHHLSNLLFHLLNVLLLFLLLYRMTGEVWKSGMVAALFALHPVNVDSVAWIAERKNLLSTTFWMLTLLAYIRYAAKPSALRYLLIMMVFSIGLMAKPMLVTLPCALLLLDFWPLYRFQWFRENWLHQEALPSAGRAVFQTASISRLVLEKIPLLMLSFAAIWLSFLSLQKNSQILTEAAQPIGLRIANALVSYLHYLWKMIWPSNLAIFYPFPNEIPLWQPVAAVIALIGITALAIVHSRRKPYLATGWFWYLGTLTPVIGIIQGGLWPQIADRWAYIPFIGVFIAMAWAGWAFLSRSCAKAWAGAGISIFLLVLLASLTTKQLTYWKNTDTLFQHTLNVTRDNYYAHVLVGRFFSAAGDHDKALRHFQKALDLQPVFDMAHESMGDTYVLQKKYDQAILHYQKALFISISDPLLLIKIGNAYAGMGNHHQAIQFYLESLSIDPDDPSAYSNLGAAYYFIGQLEAAAQNLKKAIELKPDYAEAYYNLGLVEIKTGNAQPATTYFKQAVKINPDYADAHNSLGKICFQSGDMAKALLHFKEVTRISAKDASAYYNIGIILYTQHETSQAAQYFQKALEINPAYEKAKQALKITGN